MKLIIIGILLVVLSRFLYGFWVRQTQVWDCEKFLRSDPICEQIFGGVSEVAYRDEELNQYRSFSGVQVEEVEWMFSISSKNYQGFVQLSWVSSAQNPFLVVQIDEVDNRDQTLRQVWRR